MFDHNKSNFIARVLEILSKSYLTLPQSALEEVLLAKGPGLTDALKSHFGDDFAARNNEGVWRMKIKRK
jgi:hypothetical protein